MFGYGDENLTMNEFLTRQNQFKEWDDNVQKALIQWFVDPDNNSHPTFETICPYLDDYSEDNQALKRWIRRFGMDAAFYNIGPSETPGAFYVLAEDMLKEAVEDLFQVVITLRDGSLYVIRRGAHFNKQLFGKYEWGSRMYDDWEFHHRDNKCTVLAGTVPMSSATIEFDFHNIVKIRS